MTRWVRELLKSFGGKVNSGDYATLITTENEKKRKKKELSDIKKTRSDVPDSLQKPFQQLQPQIVLTVTVATQMLLLNFSNKYNFSFPFFFVSFFFARKVETFCGCDVHQVLTLISFSAKEKTERLKHGENLHKKL